MGSLGMAAREHGISQPAASARIQALERRLALVLVERSPSGSRLRPAGVTVAQWARRVVDAAAELHAGATALRNAREALLSVGASMTIAEYLMPRWLVTLRASRPQLTVALRAENSHDVVEQVRGGDADLGFVEDLSSHPDLCEHLVGHDELVVVVSPGHPWACLPGPLTAAGLAAGQLVLREPGSGTREILDRVLDDLRDGDTPHLELTSPTAIKEAVTGGAGAAVLSILAVDRELRAGQLVRVPVTGITLTRRFRAVRRKDRQLTEPATALLHIAKGEASQSDHRQR
ncbi:LysR family transcriptional regulator [Actinophytocola sp.]|uniref:LysR family transcriptional regulator n=1 Tax=Actinophytocola sp. TaxID=1872138 RepID=UPI0025BDCF6B|nr:LysR family transcriptional regulator [Actinophytocola sp.]